MYPVKNNVVLTINEDLNKNAKILDSIDVNINEISKVTLNAEKKEISKTEEIDTPLFTTDIEVNQLIYSAIVKIQKYERKRLDQVKELLNLYIPLGGRSTYDSKEPADAFEQVIQFINHKNQSSLLFMGAAGSGKTVFVNILAQFLWQAHAQGIVKDKPIPIMISLSSIDNIQENLIEQHFTNILGLNAKESALLQKHASFIFILEGYEERNLFKNLYQANHLDQWRCKVITTCRGQALLHRENNYPSLFFSGLKEETLNELILSPFTDEQLKKYIQESVKKPSHEKEWDVPLYWNIFSQMPSVLALVRTPFILSVTVKALPQWSKNSDGA